MSAIQERRLALVTGGASGLGRDLCMQLAAGGWHVVVADVDLAGAEQTLSAIQDIGGRGQAEELDVCDPAAWDVVAAKLRADWTQLDLLINNAGICAAGKMGVAPLADFRRVSEVNLFGVVNGCHTMVPWMRETAPGGAIVNISSVAALLNAPAMVAYSVAKAGVISLSETLANELRDVGIGVTVVLPGFFPSQLLDRGSFTDELFRRIAQEYTNYSSTTSADVARRTLKAVENREFFVPVGWRVRLIWHVKRLVPNLFRRMVGCKFASDEAKYSDATPPVSDREARLHDETTSTFPPCR